MPWNQYDRYGQLKITNANALPVMVPIFDTTLTGTQATIDIQNIPQTYAHLRLALVGRGDTALTSTTALVRFNNDSGSNYDDQRHYGTASTAGADETLAQTSARIGYVAAASATAAFPGSTVVEIPNYTGTTFNKHFSALSLYHTGTATGNLVTQGIAGGWRNAAAISRITILPGAGNFVAGTRVTLYGIGVLAPPSPGSVIPVTYSTTLPSSPVDGQEAILVDNVNTPTYSWRFRYNANSSNTDKWEFVGGPPLEASVNDATLETLTSSASYTDFTTNASLVCPRTGQYKIEFGVTVAPPSGPGNDLYVVSTVSAGDNDAIFTSAQASASSQYVTLSKSIGQKAIAAGATVKLQYKTNTGNGASRRSKYVRIIPVRVS